MILLGRWGGRGSGGDSSRDSSSGSSMGMPEAIRSLTGAMTAATGTNHSTTSLGSIHAPFAITSTHLLNLVSSKPRNLVNDNPRERPSKIHNLVHGKRHDPRRQHIIAHVRIPASPQLFEVVERWLSESDLVDMLPIVRNGVCYRNDNVAGG